MPGGGIAAAAKIRAGHPKVRIAMLTASEADHDVMAAMKAGAIGYVLKGVSAAAVLAVLGEVADGRAMSRRRWPPGFSRRCRSPVRRTAGPDRRPEQARGGHPAPRRARPEQPRDRRRTGLQEKTVKHYMTIILEKLQARNRVEAALLAQRAGDLLGSRATDPRCNRSTRSAVLSRHARDAPQPRRARGPRRHARRTRRRVAPDRRRDQ